MIKIKKIAIVTVLFTAFSFNFIFSQEKQTEIPPFDAGRVTGEVFTGLGGALVLGYGLGFVGYLMLPGPWLVLGGSLGCVTGAVAGVTFIGNLGNETGAILSTSIGTISAYALSVLSLMIIKKASIQLDDLATFYFPIIGGITAIGATIGFNISRKYKKAKTGDLLFRYDNNGIAVSYRFCI